MADFPKTIQTVLLASGARTTTQTLGPYSASNDQGDVFGIEVVLDLTAFVTAASLTLSIEQYNEGSAGYLSILAATAITANGQKRLRLFPGCQIAANASDSGFVPGLYRVVVTHGNANSHTYSVTIHRTYMR